MESNRRRGRSFHEEYDAKAGPDISISSDNNYSDDYCGPPVLQSSDRYNVPISNSCSDDFEDRGTRSRSRSIHRNDFEPGPVQVDTNSSKDVNNLDVRAGCERGERSGLLNTREVKALKMVIIIYEFRL